MSKTVLLVGAGWLGLPLGSHLAGEGYNVTATTTTSEKISTIRAAGMTPELVSLPEWDSNGETSYDWCIITIPPNRNSSNTKEDYLAQIRSIVEEVSATNWVFFSTTGVYPDNNSIVLEEGPTRPKRSTAAAMLAAEGLLKKQLGDQLTIFRLAGLAGPGREPGRFFAGKKAIPGGEGPVNFVHQNDIIRAVDTYMLAPKFGEIYNLCSDQHPRKKKFYSERARKMGGELPEFLPEEGHWKKVSNSKFKQEFDFEYRYPDPINFPS